MKRLLFSCLLFLAVACPAWASPQGPLHMYFPEADTIYDVKVASVEKDKITFSVVDILRGKKVATLALHAEYDVFKKDDELMLLSSEAWRKGDRGDVVGGFMEGEVGWIYTPVFREDGKAYVYDQLFDLEKMTPVFDKKIGSWNCITLEHFKQMLAGKPFVSWYIGAELTIKRAADYGSDVVIATFAPADTWKPVDREPDTRFIDMQVIDALKGAFSGKVPVIFPVSIEYTKPEPGGQYIAFLAKWGNDYRIYKMLPATKENIDSVKAVIAAK